MPGYKGHITFSLAIGLIYYLVVFLFSINIGVLQEPIVVGGVFLSLLLFGLWPDVDTNSLGQDIFYPIFLIVAIVLLITDKPYASALVGIFSMLPTIGKHRGWTHDLWAALLIPSLFLIIVPSLSKHQWNLEFWPYAVSGTIGYLGHLLIDGELKPTKLFKR